MTTFEEQFPSLFKLQVTIEFSELEKAREEYDTAVKKILNKVMQQVSYDVAKCCLDKQRVKEAINNCLKLQEYRGEKDLFKFIEDFEQELKLHQ